MQVAKDSEMVPYDDSIADHEFGTSIAGNEANLSLAGLSVARSRPP